MLQRCPFVAGGMDAGAAVLAGMPAMGTACTDGATDMIAGGGPSTGPGGNADIIGGGPGGYIGGMGIGMGIGGPGGGAWQAHTGGASVAIGAGGQQRRRRPSRPGRQW